MSLGNDYEGARSQERVDAAMNTMTDDLKAVERLAKVCAVCCPDDEAVQTSGKATGDRLSYGDLRTLLRLAKSATEQKG